jgi:hypothetical protein
VAPGAWEKVALDSRSISDLKKKIHDKFQRYFEF